MKNRKLIILSRSEEARRKDQVYDYYNANAQKILNKGKLLTDFKEQIAEKFGYKGFQSVSNLLAKRDSKRRADISKTLISLNDELSIPMEANTEGVNIKAVKIKKGEFIFNLKVQVRYTLTPIQAPDVCVPPLSILSTIVDIVSVKKNGKLLFLNSKDILPLMNFFNRNIKPLISDTV